MTMYAYIKGDKYDKYSVQFDGNKYLNKIDKSFDTIEKLYKFVTYYSNYASVPVQFYI